MIKQLIFGLLVVSLVLARPVFQETAKEVAVGSRRYAEPETVVRDFEHGERRMSYDVTLKQNVVLVNERQEIEAVECAGLDMALVFAKGKRVAVRPGDLLVGGAEWGCVHPEHGKVLPFHRRVESVGAYDAQHDRLALHTSVAEIGELFEQADVRVRNTVPSAPQRYDVPQGQVIGQAEPEDLGDIVEGPEEEDGKAARRGSSSADFAFGSLEQVYFTGDKVAVSYTYSTSKYGRETFNACLMLKRIGFDKKVTCKAVTLSSYGSGGVEFTVLSNYEASTSYYVRLTHARAFGKSFETDEFGVNPETLILTPTHASEYFAGMDVDLSWYAKDEHKGKVVELALIRDGLLAKTVRTWQLPLGAGKLSIPVDTLPAAADAGKYYFRITYSCAIGSLFCELKETSDKFSLSRGMPGEKVVYISRPTEGAVYDKDTPIEISWSSEAMSKAETVKVSVCRDSYGVDPCPLRQYATKNTGKLTVIPKESWKGSSTYYVSVQYDCKLFWCATRESRRFAVNYKPQFEFLAPTPVAGTVVAAPSDITVAYRLRADATIAADKQVSVKLMRQVPLLDLVHNGATKTVAAGSGRTTFSITEGTVFPVRFMIAYDCKIAGYFCKREYSPVFYVPSTFHKGWNDEGTDRIQLFSIACGSKCAGSDNAFCKVCESVPDLKAKIDVACEKCFVTTDVSAYDFSLNVNGLGVTSASMHVDGTAVANLDVGVAFDAAYKFQTEFELAHYDLIGTSFKIGPVDIALAARVSLNTTLAFSVKGSAAVSAGFDATVGFKAETSVGGADGDKHDVKFGLTRFNKHDPTIDLRVDVYGKAGIKPVIDFNIVDMLRFWFALQPYLDLSAKFQLPAFNPTGYPDADSLAHLGVACDEVDHYTEYDLRLHLEATAYGKIAKKEWTSPVYTLLDKSLVSGCLFASKGPLDEETYTIAATVQGLGFADEDSFKLAFVELVADNLTNAKASRLEATVKEGEVSNTINVVLKAFQTEDAHENIDFARLTDVIRNTYSDFYSTSLGRLLKDKISPYSP